MKTLGEITGQSLSLECESMSHVLQTGVLVTLGLI